jgi:glycosyltransferase involved in cell wall biosynthesis
MRRLSVLHVIGGGDTGGAMSHLLPLLSALHSTERAETACDVHLLCLGEGGLVDRARERGLAVRVLSMKGPWDPAVLIPLRRVLTQGPVGMAALPDEAAAGVSVASAGSPSNASSTCHSARHFWHVVHTHGMRANLSVRLVIKAMGPSRRPCLFTTVHSDLLLDYASTVLAHTYRLLDQATLGSVDTVVCVSDSLRSLLLQRGYPADKTMTIWSGIEASLELASAAQPISGRPCIGTVARLAPVKDLDLLLEVVARLRRTIPQVECIIVGDGPERARLEGKARKRGLEGAVRFTGRLADIGSALARMDIYVVTSMFEGGVSMSVLEAMAAGLPVVTTFAGGVVEAVADGETGFVAKQNTARDALADELAERIATLLNNEHLRVVMGAAGARRVRDLFRVERAAERTLWAYGRCLAARGEFL